jgi:hypothetical protein
MCCNNCNYCPKRKQCNIRPYRYALGAPIVGTEQVVYNIQASFCELRKRGLFLVFVPASTDSTLPPVIQLCDGSLLPIVFSGTATAAEASGLIGNRAHLATLVYINGVASLNIFDAQNAAAAGA